MKMKKLIMPAIVIGLIFLTTVNACCMANPATSSEQRAASPQAGKGTIKGTITNQNGHNVAFVRVYAVNFQEKEFGFAYTHLISGKGEYTMKVPGGNTYFLRAARLPFYFGAYNTGVYVDEGETKTVDFTIYYLLDGLDMPHSNAQSSSLQRPLYRSIPMIKPFLSIFRFVL